MNYSIIITIITEFIIIIIIKLLVFLIQQLIKSHFNQIKPRNMANY
jgi:hypothetical protein